MANSIQLYGAQIKREAPITLEGEWFSTSLTTLARMGDADLLDEGDSFTINDFPRVKMPKEADADWKLDVPSVDQNGEVQDVTRIPAIDGVILYSRNVRLYWKSAYGEGSTGPPDCKSTDGVTGEGTPGGDCHACEMNQWGSAARLGLRHEGNAKACAQRTELYILTPFSPFPIVVSAPPTSLRTLRAYRLSVFAQSGHAYHKVVTRIELEAAQNADGKDYVTIKPKLLALPSPKEAEAIATVREDFVRLIRGSDVVVDIEETDAPSPPSAKATELQKAASACVDQPRGKWSKAIQDTLGRPPTKEQFAEVVEMLEQRAVVKAAGGVGDDLPF